MRGFPPGDPTGSQVIQFPPPSKTPTSGVSPVSAPDRGTGSESGAGPRVLGHGFPLLLRDGLNADQISLCAVYVSEMVGLGEHTAAEDHVVGFLVKAAYDNLPSRQEHMEATACEQRQNMQTPSKQLRSECASLLLHGARDGTLAFGSVVCSI